MQKPNLAINCFISMCHFFSFLVMFVWQTTPKCLIQTYEKHWKSSVWLIKQFTRAVCEQQPRPFSLESVKQYISCCTLSAWGSLHSCREFPVGQKWMNTPGVCQTMCETGKRSSEWGCRSKTTTSRCHSGGSRARNLTFKQDPRENWGL